MGSELDLDILDGDDGDGESPWTEDVSRGRTPVKDRDCRRAIEDLREERRLRALLTDYEFDDDSDD